MHCTDFVGTNAVMVAKANRLSLNVWFEEGLNICQSACTHAHTHTHTHTHTHKHTHTQAHNMGLFSVFQSYRAGKKSFLGQSPNQYSI